MICCADSIRMIDSQAKRDRGAKRDAADHCASHSQMIQQLNRIVGKLPDRQRLRCAQLRFRMAPAFHGDATEPGNLRETPRQPAPASPPVRAATSQACHRTLRRPWHRRRSRSRHCLEGTSSHDMTSSSDTSQEAGDVCRVLLREVVADQRTAITGRHESPSGNCGNPRRPVPQPQPLRLGLTSFV